jgi:excisionase family DNA binding protein
MGFSDGLEVGSSFAIIDSFVLLGFMVPKRDLDEHGFEPLLKLQEAAALLGMHWKTLEKMARTKEVPAFRIGGRWRFRSSLLNEWLQKSLVSGTGDEVELTPPVAPREKLEEK